jgi:hypothetical protein
MEFSGAKMGDCIFIKQCVDCTILINPKKCSKVIIDKCQNSTIVLETTLVSAVVEIIGSEKCNVTFKKMEKDDTYITVQCDKSTNTNFKFLPFEFMLPGIIIMSCPKSLDNMITLPDSVRENEFLTHHIEIIESDAVQHRTHYKNGKVHTVPIIREGIGYVTTKDEKKSNDERMEKINTKIQESLSDMIKVKPKEMKENKVKPKDLSIDEDSVPSKTLDLNVHHLNKK